jgi:hypothetical protein
MARGTGNAEQGTSRIYVGCANGVFSKRVKEPTEKSIQRTLEKGVNAGKIVHEEHFDYFEGALLAIEAKEKEGFGKQWTFEFDISLSPEKQEILVFNCPYTSGYAQNILVRLPNLDLTKDVKVMAYSFLDKEKNKERKGITLFQSGAKVNPAYSKENPNGLPPMVQVKIKGQLVWDNTDMFEFLEEMVKTKIVPKLPKVETTEVKQETALDQVDTVKAFEAEAPEAAFDVEDDDIPF